MQRLGCMFAHISNDVLHCYQRLLLRHTGIGHYQKDNIAYGRLGYLWSLFHNKSFYICINEKQCQGHKCGAINV